MRLRRNFNATWNLFQAFHELRRDDDGPPDSRMVSGILFCITNSHLIDLLRQLLRDPTARAESRALSKRSSLFDKLIIMKGTSPHPWVLRLHTYQVPRGPGYRPGGGTRAGRARVSNLGEELRDDEANTHFHRWQLGSRFLSGGFNNVTWDVDDTRRSRHRDEDRQTRFGIPATSRAGSTGRRVATDLGDAWVTQRRSDFYVQGDVVAYPIVDAHSVSSAMAPFVGTTMTFAHTGREELDDSCFFERPTESGLSSVRQESFSPEEHVEAIHRGITRLQLVELNTRLGHRRHRSAPLFRHMNSFETELLPRIAELFVLSSTYQSANRSRWTRRGWVTNAATVDLDEEALTMISEMDSRALAYLIIASQRHLLDASFEHDMRALESHHREFQALDSRLRTGSRPQNARRYSPETRRR